MNPIKLSLIAGAIGASGLVGGAVGASVMAGNAATTVLTAAPVATVAATAAPAAAAAPAAGTFTPNEDATHEAGESAAREAQENSGQMPTVP